MKNTFQFAGVNNILQTLTKTAEMADEDDTKYCSNW